MLLVAMLLYRGRWGETFTPTLTGGSTELSQGFEQPEVDIVTGAITGSPFCAGTTINVPFTASGFVDVANVYTAQLSDASGSFTSPVTLGSITSTAISGTIVGSIPFNTGLGTGYLVRVVSSTPVYFGKVSATIITINPAPVFSANGTNITCNGAANGSIAVTVTTGTSPYTYSVTGATPFPYSTSPITSLAPNTYNVLVKVYVFRPKWT
jgi:SprB repeat